MKISSIQSFPGRNIYSYGPVIKMVVDTGEFSDRFTKDIKGFNENLLNMFPGLSKHHCSLGYEGGFAERLREGTLIGHVTEHLVLELQNMLGYNVYFGKTRLIEEPSLYYIVFEYENERYGLECARTAVKIVCDVARGKEVNLGQIMEVLRTVVRESELGPTTKSIFEEAKKRRIPISRLNEESLLQLGYGKYLRLVQASLTDKPSCIAVDIAGNKQLTKQILKDHGMPVPMGDVAYTEESTVIIGEHLGYPLVVKPYNGNQGKGVVLNIWNEGQLREAFREAIKHSNGVIVERQVRGKDYRVLVVGDRVSAVSERMPACVVGDGVHTIKELVELENRDELRGEGHEKPLSKLALDKISIEVLKSKGLDEDFVPALFEKISIRENCNLSTGGTARDCTAEIHPDTAGFAVQAANAIGLDIAGIDITAQDISKPLDNENGAIIEVNASPGLRMHLHPTEGEGRHVAGDILDMLFPPGTPYSIPIVSITGTNGKTTTARLISHILSLWGKKVGLTCTSGTYIENRCILKGDNTGPRSARLVLSHREVEAAVLETARGGIVKRGLGYDLADVGIVTNIGEDHLGQDGIENLEDLAYVKALVVETIKKDGYAVLNADDPMTEYLIKRVRSHVMFFSQQKSSSLLLNYTKGDTAAVYLEDKILCFNDGTKVIPVIDLDEAPITFGGLVECNILNAAASAAAAFALGVPVKYVSLGLSTFQPDTVSNPGRFNILDVRDFKVMLDYGHNPDGYREVIKFAGKINAGNLLGVIGMPGDRTDKSIRKVGQLCGLAFSRIFIKEDQDLRGRTPGEVAEILYQAVLEGGAERENVQVILPESSAFRTALLEAQQDDLIILFYEEYEQALELVQEFINAEEHNKRNEIIPELVSHETTNYATF
ncbi:MAG: cyanophycin synthetase [Desulfitobacteriaceae bacterium]|nr:cyanophycin synthetase [Desulfitobacteriaceae bacterium]MDD4752305.1 cyanophycin synthetase [Desulfitobacteriaceae bacterium]